jgi:hypothetical protein
MLSAFREYRDGLRFHHWRQNLKERRQSLKEIIHVVTQTLACCSRRSFAGRCRIGADLGLGLGRAWLARWLAWRLAWRLRLGRAALLCRWPRLLWRLLCAAVGPDSLGTALAPDQPLLLIGFKRPKQEGLGS